MPHPPPQSFLLRLWHEHEDAPLRATLISVAQPAETRHFTTLDALHRFLCTQGGGTSEPADWSTTDCTASELYCKGVIS